MEKTQIVNARIEQISGGPDIGIFCGEVELKPAGGDSVFLSITEADGCPMIFKTDHSVFDMLVDPDEFGDDLDELEANSLLYESDGYAELFENGESFECIDGIRYLVYLIRASWDEIDAFIVKTKGKNLEEIEIPEPNLGEDWEEELG